MTEVHHGSNVAALQTEAIFSKDSDEWIITTPNDGALEMVRLQTLREAH